MHLARITVYPVKSLDGVDVSVASIGTSGNLLNDRRYAIVDDQGKYINGKFTPEIHRLRTCFHSAMEVIEIKSPTSSIRCDLSADRKILNEFLSDYFQKVVLVKEDTEGNFLDNPEESKMTIVSEESLFRVSGWFGWQDANEAHQRFRPNLVVTGVPAFWEDTLFNATSESVRFCIGDVVAKGTGPCPRCVVPSRNPITGVQDREFQKRFTTHRQNELPTESALSSFGHYYQLATNCVVEPSEFGKRIRVGDQFLNA
jgi:uncharacterized protein YcbX